MGRTADAIAGGDLSHRVDPADERSEIGRLGLALNRMLHRLEGAFKEREASEGRLRQFLADASHELRTPLVSIRGYSELYRLGATSDKEEVDRSMARIEQEAARMGVLVEDMLTLARLDETHDNQFAPVDLSAIAADAVRDAEVAAPGRKITLTADGAETVTGDSHQLQQVIANLLRNAIVHTPDDTPIDVTVARSGDDVRLDVRDHGPGLPDDAGDHIFERFWRSEAGRERGKAGSGLGLSIVAGIVEAHGGRVHAKNASDGGAIFSVWLPLPGLSQLPV
jgi:two-component system OmpR family sensor kinase